jgi:hypothetical protein
MDNIELHIYEKNKAKTEVIDAGTLIEYLFKNTWKEAQVSEVHYDDICPYYSILLEKDNVIIARKTIRQKIRYPQSPSKSKLPPLFRRGSMPFKAKSSETGRQASCGQVMPYQ